MSIRTRLFLMLFALAMAGLYMFSVWVVDDFRLRYHASMEEPMVDMANVLASMLETETTHGQPSTELLREALDTAGKRRFSANIFEMLKTRINVRVYVTDARGKVVFDSDGGKDEGKDYSRWNDVARTLRGEYGARASRAIPNNPMSAMLCVAAPIRTAGKISGVVAVCKPADSIEPFIETARQKVLVAGAGFAVAVILLGIAVSFWITRPIARLTQYAKSVRDGKRATLPPLGNSEIGSLGRTFEEMRTALEGKQYVEEYVQALTHQMKSPLSAIKGAAELMKEDMPAEQRERFLENIRQESGRIQNIVERMLELSAVENRRKLQEIENIDLLVLIREVLSEMKPLFGNRMVTLEECGNYSVMLVGERFLLRQILMNLLQNSIDFSGVTGRIVVSVNATEKQVEISVKDNGAGIPEYALDRVFERFYSLQRPDTGRKSSGLGLAFVKEATTLHNGGICLKNNPDGGTQAVLTLPLVQ